MVVWENIIPNGDAMLLPVMVGTKVCYTIHKQEEIESSIRTRMYLLAINTVQGQTRSVLVYKKRNLIKI